MHVDRAAAGSNISILVVKVSCSVPSDEGSVLSSFDMVSPPSANFVGSASLTVIGVTSRRSIKFVCSWSHNWALEPPSPARMRDCVLLVIVTS